MLRIMGRQNAHYKGFKRFFYVFSWCFLGVLLVDVDFQKVAEGNLLGWRKKRVFKYFSEGEFVAMRVLFDPWG